MNATSAELELTLVTMPTSAAPCWLPARTGELRITPSELPAPTLALRHQGDTERVTMGLAMAS